MKFSTEQSVSAPACLPEAALANFIESFWIWGKFNYCKSILESVCWIEKLLSFLMGSLKFWGLNVGVNAEKFRKVVVFIFLGFPQTQQFSYPMARPDELSSSTIHLKVTP